MWKTGKKKKKVWRQTVQGMATFFNLSQIHNKINQLPLKAWKKVKKMPFLFEVMIKRYCFLKYYYLLSPAICLLWELFYSVTFRFYRFLVLFFKLIKSLLLDNLELFTAQKSRMMSEWNILRTFNHHPSY